MPLVSVIRKGVHDNRGQDIGRRDEALRSSYVESHADVQNDGKEVGDRVCTGGSQAKEAGKAPDLQIQAVLEVLPDIEPVIVVRTRHYQRKSDGAYSSGTTSCLSFSILAQTKSASAWFKNFSPKVLTAFSGKSTMMK